jgi:hypothetical protein
MLDELAGCSQVSEFMMLNKDLSVVLLNSPESISLAAWNGSKWSKPQVQNEIAAFVNPATFDNVIFGCQKVSIHEGQLFIVGCDKGNGGDIWFSSRSLETIEDWFPSSLTWTAPVDVTNVDQEISALSSVADGENNIHTFWVQTPSLDRDTGETKIQYVGWKGQSWSNPATIISELDGTPMQLTVKADSQKRILLTWIDSKKGNLFFTWAESNRASTASGWETPQSLPSVSQVNRSPDILVDDSGKIIVAYAIPINEQRGIYFVQSDDGGTNWTQPFQIFDAAAAGWDIVDQPDISLTADGRLHVMFKRYSFQGEPRQSLGLYYTYSENGGVTWIDPEKVSEHPVPWSEIIRYDGQILHRLWQEYNQSMLISFHQISQDGGVTWSSPVIVSSISSNTSLATQTMDRAGNLHFLQLTGKDNLTFLSHMWNGSSWISQEPQELYIKDRGIPSSITAGVSSNGDLLVSVLVDYPYLTSELKWGILSLGKSLELPEEMQTPYPAIIAVAEPTSGVAEDMSNILQSTAQTLPVSDLNNLPSSSSRNKNLVGILLLGGLIVLISIIFLSIFRKHDNPKKTSK